MLELRPNCENCNLPLPPNSRKAMICSFECTFCRDCVTRLSNCCPNCGGGFCQRPIRPKLNHRNNNDLEHHPGSDTIIFKPVDLIAHRTFSANIEVDPKKR